MYANDIIKRKARMTRTKKEDNATMAISRETQESNDRWRKATVDWWWEYMLSCPTNLA